MVPPRPRAPRRARTKRLAPTVSARTDELHGAMDATFGDLVVPESRLSRFADSVVGVWINDGMEMVSATWMHLEPKKNQKVGVGPSPSGGGCEHFLPVARFLDLVDLMIPLKRRQCCFFLCGLDHQFRIKQRGI